MIANKNLVFTVTHGRTGTTFLTEAFALFDDTLSLHEPEPNYAATLPRVKQNPAQAVEFLKHKLAFIEGISESNYVETSNVFCKGFLLPLIRMGVTPNLILLNRNFRKTAHSLFQRGSFPMRSRNGQHYSADPRVPGSLPIADPESLSDYQLCFWGVLDAYARQRQIAAIYDREQQAAYHWATAQDFHRFEQLKAVGSSFGLAFQDEDQAARRHAEIIQVHHNPNRGQNQSAAILSTAASEEAAVLDRIAYLDPLFVAAVLDSSFVDSDLKAIFEVQ